MDNRKGDKRVSFQQFSSLIGIGLVFPLSIVIGYGIGYYLDRWLGTSYLRIVFLLFGIASGFVSFFRSISAAEREEKSEGDSKSDSSQ
jgi:ATP synthase protein I